MCPKLPPTAQPVPPLSREPHCISRPLQTNHRNLNYFNKESSQSLMNDEAPALTWSVKSVCDFRYFRKRNLFQFYVFSVFISYLRKNEKSRTLFLWIKSQGEDHASSDEALWLTLGLWPFLGDTSERWVFLWPETVLMSQTGCEVTISKRLRFKATRWTVKATLGVSEAEVMWRAILVCVPHRKWLRKGSQSY